MGVLKQFILRFGAKTEKDLSPISEERGRRKNEWRGNVRKRRGYCNRAMKKER